MCLGLVVGVFVFVGVLLLVVRFVWAADSGFGVAEAVASVEGTAATTTGAGVPMAAAGAATELTGVAVVVAVNKLAVNTAPVATDSNRVFTIFPPTEHHVLFHPSRRTRQALARWGVTLNHPQRRLGPKRRRS